MAINSLLKISPPAVLGMATMLTLAGAPGADAATIIIDPNDDSCVPASTEFESCAKACEADALGCAQDIQDHISGQSFAARRELYPTTEATEGNPITPMHGLFNTIYVNQQAKDAIEAVIASPFDPVDLPPWSIVAKNNENPKPDDPDTLEVWQTAMYKIPGYCPERAVASPDSACVGGEWFWYLFRSGGFLVFDFNEEFGGREAWGKAEAFCLECHGAVSESDWLWITHYRRERERQVAEPTRIDNQTPGALGAAQCDGFQGLIPLIPPDVIVDPASLSPADAQRMFDCFAWKAFIGLNWPASSIFRGLPGLVPFHAPNRSRVWETYAQVYETFQPQDPTWTLEGKSWNSRQPLPEVCQQALDEAPGSFPGNARTFPVLNESHQAFGNQFNSLVDTNSNQVRYEVRFNRTEWRYLQDKGFADTGSYDYQGPVGETVVLPDNRADYGLYGAIEIKAAWKELCTDPAKCKGIDDPERYYARPAFIYDQEVKKSLGTQPASCRVAEVGLVGLHTVFKTFWAPQWIWATFEHVDNVPEDLAAVKPGDPPYTLFDPQCLIDPPTPEQCQTQRPGVIPNSDPKLSCCVNLQMIQNSNPAPDNVIPFNGEPVTDLVIPNQITRIEPVGASAQDLNTVFQGLLAEAGSPFQYYKLINTQWPIGGRLGKTGDPKFAVVQKLCLDEHDTEPCYELAPPAPSPYGLRLRNTTMETYQVSTCEPDGESIDSPSDCTPESVAHDPFQVASAGCMNCHLPSGADASFLWEDAIWERVPLNDGIAEAESSH